ncbi:hypothetical protein LAZ67_15002242 [Cordylochernes scorpioides]|uniref:Cytochrome P450 n=1 Tax=Cordylochernes scorpioides TaxID=51811 RepID=A0ABY6LBI2_9ARAC|nr:hypothetical protein LAZ67_15002242 [Cordylochernes scorpioides]
MAQIQTPETFNFSTPNELPKWRKRFELYLVVSGMKKKEEADKIDLFMYLMGDRADDIFSTVKFEKEEEATKIESVLKAFDSHFYVRKNIIYERAKFNSRIQEDREPVDEFITSLCKLADSCEFEGLHEQLIRDRIVVGVRDKALSERMQLASELTLEMAVKMVRQQEAVRQQQVDLQRPSTSQKINQVKFNSKKPSPKQQQQPLRKKEKSAKTISLCPKCGGFTHRDGQACHKQAKTAEVKAVSELDEEIRFLLGVSAVEYSSNLDDDEGECRRRWTAQIQVNGKQVKFKLDSQADVTCVPLCLFKKIMGQQRLVESDINHRAAEIFELQTVGMFILTLRNGNYEIKEKIYVIRRLSEPLLSRRACELLNLARRIEVVVTKINPIKEFPEVFEGLGQIGNPYEIKLKPGAKPYAVHTPRRVPIPLMEKLKTRLEELEKAGIIAQVNVATEWACNAAVTRQLQPLYNLDIFNLTTLSRNYKSSISYLRSYTRKVIEGRKSELVQNPALLGTVDPESMTNLNNKKPFLDLLLYHHMVTGELTLEDIEDEVNTFLFEGHDTTASGLSFTIYLLGLHPDIQEKVRSEVLEHLGPLEQPMTPEGLKELRYLEMVIKESMRLYPPVMHFSRQLQSDIELGGKKIPKGVVIAVSPTGFHYNPTYFPSPEIFDPERFNLENSKKRHPFAYIPFSVGPRNCIGTFTLI